MMTLICAHLYSWSLLKNQKPICNPGTVIIIRCHLITWCAFVSNSFSYEKNDLQSVKLNVPETWSQFHTHDLNFTYNWYFSKSVFTGSILLSLEPLMKQALSSMPWKGNHWWHIITNATLHNEAIAVKKLNKLFRIDDVWAPM